MSVSPEFFDLLDLQKHLRRSSYDALGLQHLEKLRYEVDIEIERRCYASRRRKREQSFATGVPADFSEWDTYAEEGGSLDYLQWRTLSQAPEPGEVKGE